jgi:hypothetical protein
VPFVINYCQKSKPFCTKPYEQEGDDDDDDDARLK